VPDETYPAGDPVVRADSVLVEGEAARIVHAGDPASPAILLLHGWGASAYSFRKVIPELARSGYYAVVPELRGHGGSDKPRLAGAYTAQAMAVRVAAVIDALRLAPVAMVGQSIGGAIVLDLAAMRPDLVSAAVLVSPIGFTSLRRVDVLRRLRVWTWAPTRPGRWMIELVMRRIYGVRGRWTARDVDEYWTPLREPGATAALLSLVRSFEFGRRSPEAVAHLGARLRLLFGDRDRPVPLREALAHAARFSTAHIEVLRGVGHVAAEEAPAEVVSAILAVAKEVVGDARSDGRADPPD